MIVSWQESDIRGGRQVKLNNRAAERHIMAYQCRIGGNAWGLTSLSDGMTFIIGDETAFAAWLNQAGIYWPEEFPQ